MIIITHKTIKIMNKKSLYSIAVAAAFVAGYSAYNEYGRTKLSGALLANVEALAETEDEGGNPEAPVPACPDPYDVPDHYIEVTSSSVEVECTTAGSVSVGTSTFNGSYQKGKKYAFIISTYNCSGKQAGACCKQSDVRTEIH